MVSYERLVKALLDGVGDRHTLITIGKGGVGKTTMSILASLVYSERGSTLLASLDPAKHLLEYLGLQEPLQKVRVSGRFYAVQYDISPIAKRLADEYSLLLRQVMPALTILNLDDIVKSVRHAPGFEEEVFLRVMEELYSQEEFEFVVVDTPPTGVTHRILNLPRLYVFWLEQLYELRSRIVSLRYAIARAMGRKEELRDPVLDKLRALHERYSRLWDMQRDPSRTSAMIVATPEPLPVYEARETVEFLESIGVRCRLLVANRILPWDKALELGLAETQARSLEQLSRFGGPGCVKLGVMQHRRAPRRLEDVEELKNLVVEIGEILAEARV